MMLKANKTGMYRLCKDVFPSIPGMRTVAFRKGSFRRSWWLTFTLPSGERHEFYLTACVGRAVLSDTWHDAEGASHYEAHTLDLAELLALGLVEGAPTSLETQKPLGVKFWHVALPASEMWLASNDPRGDLVALGYDAFALTQVVAMGSYDMPPMNVVPESFQDTHQEAQDTPSEAQDAPQSDEQTPSSSPVLPAQETELAVSDALLAPGAVLRSCLASGGGAYRPGPAPFTVIHRGGQAAPAETLRRTKEAGRVGSAVGGASPASAPYGGGAPPGRAAQPLPAWDQARPSCARAQRQP